MATAAAVRTALVEALAKSRATTAAKIEQAITDAGGDDVLQIRSKIAEAVIARLEKVFGVKLPGPADLDRTEFATVGALLALLVGRLKDA